LVYADFPPIGPPILARYNCWGNNFNPNQDLYPSSLFIYSPTWCPPGGKNQPNPDEQEAAYNNAVNEFESGNYAEAKTLFESVVHLYPSSVFAQESMKELFRLEQFVGNDYNQLKTYLTSNDSIVADSVLIRLGQFLANSCDIKLENWESAISWQENRIINPISFQDSIFGIIDLGYTYLMMENSGNKSSYTGLLLEYKPKSAAEHRERRNRLLTLLPEGDLNNTIRKELVELESDRLLNNIPNPFSTSTTIYYKLSKPSDVVIKVFDLLGKEQMKIYHPQRPEGAHKAEIQATGLSAGTYTFTLEINGVRTDTKKMIVVK